MAPATFLLFAMILQCRRCLIYSLLLSTDKNKYTWLIFRKILISQDIKKLVEGTYAWTLTWFFHIFCSYFFESKSKINDWYFWQKTKIFPNVFFRISQHQICPPIWTFLSNMCVIFYFVYCFFVIFCSILKFRIFFICWTAIIFFPYFYFW